MGARVIFKYIRCGDTSFQFNKMSTAVSCTALKHCIVAKGKVVVNAVRRSSIKGTASWDLIMSWDVIISKETAINAG